MSGTDKINVPNADLFVVACNEGLTCMLCGASSFGDSAAFRGSTENCKNNFYVYKRCNSCGTIINAGPNNADYSNYGGGKKKFRLRTLRFVSFFKKMNISKTDNILDYGCGGGGFVQSLKEKGYLVEGYEPYNSNFDKTLDYGKTFSVVYLIQVFEHIPDYNVFFAKLAKVTNISSMVITIHPSSTRLLKLNPGDSLQCWNVHAPYHTCVPSDQMTIKLFSDSGYKLIQHIPYDIQRSGFFENNRVSALLRKNLGGTRECLIKATKVRRILAYLKSPLLFLNYMFFQKKDNLVSTFVFERIKKD